MNKQKKIAATILLSLMTILGSGIVVFAGSTGTEYVTKKSMVKDACSKVSGGTMGQAMFSAKCTKGFFWAKPQQRRYGKWQTTRATFVDKGRKVSANTSLTGSKLWKLRLSGPGKGNGSIRAR